MQHRQQRNGIEGRLEMKLEGAGDKLDDQQEDGCV